MPNRIIRGDINSSERVNKLSDGAEIFFRRLLNEVDDYGRFTADPVLLISSCYPRKINIIKESDIITWLQECIDVRGSRKNQLGLIIYYVVEGEKFLQILNFRQKERSKSKYPPPPENLLCNCNTNDCQLSYSCPADVDQMTSLGVVLGEDEDVGVGIGTTPDVAGGPPACFCRRNGKKTPATRHGNNVLLTDAEYQRMQDDWGKRFTCDAITEYDERFPNSSAIRKHTDHNLGIRDYVRRGFICQGKKPQLKNGGFPDSVLLQHEPSEEELGTPEERTDLLRKNLPLGIRNGKGMQHVSKIIPEILGECGP